MDIWHSNLPYCLTESGLHDADIGALSPVTSCQGISCNIKMGSSCQGVTCQTSWLLLHLILQDTGHCTASWQPPTAACPAQLQNAHACSAKQPEQTVQLACHESAWPHGFAEPACMTRKNTSQTPVCTTLSKSLQHGTDCSYMTNND